MLKIFVSIGLWIVLAAPTLAELRIRYDAAPESNAGDLVLDGLSEKQTSTLAALEPAKLSASFKLYVKQAYQTASAQPVLGEVSVRDQRLAFKPRFPLARGLAYMAVFKADVLGQTLSVEHEFTLPKPQMTAEAFVTTLYPTADRLPQNLLKFYVHFSHPMAQGNVYQYIELTTEDGVRLERPFLEIQEELWDQTGKRLTLLLDPGRVKRGLVPREEDGPILEAGKHYRLTIKNEWRDARGVGMTQSHIKKFVVLAEDFTQPNPDNWRITRPAAGSKDNLVFEFPEPLDHATFTRGIEIETSGGPMTGEMTFAKNEKQANFKPSKSWPAGAITIRISPLIEDLAGNSIGRAFEVDRFDRVDSPEKPGSDQQPRVIKLP